MPSSLTSDDKAKIKRAIPKASNKIISAAVARLYIAFPDPNKWKFTGLSGAIVLSRDLVGDTLFLKLVDVVGAGQVLWDQELWNGFQYNQDRTFFHSFEIEGIMAGLSFAQESEAQGFHKKLVQQPLGTGSLCHKRRLIQLRQEQRRPSISLELLRITSVPQQDRMLLSI